MRVETNCPCCGAAIVVEVNTRSAAFVGGGNGGVFLGGGTMTVNTPASTPDGDSDG